MLAAGLLCLVGVAGCGGDPPQRAEAIERYGDELRVAVSKVTDAERRGQALAVVERMQALHLRFSQETSTFIGDYRALDADQDTARARFDDLFSAYDARRRMARTEALELHFQLASLTTESEWDDISRAELRLYRTFALPVEESR